MTGVEGVNILAGILQTILADFNSTELFKNGLRQPRVSERFAFRAQLFEGRLALNPGLNLTRFLFLVF